MTSPSIHIETLHKRAYQLREKYSTIRPEDFNQEIREQVINRITYHSNKLEGLEMSYGDTINFLRKGLISKRSSLKDIKDLQNHKQVLDRIFENYNSLNLDISTIKDLHAALMKDPVQWREISPYLGGAGKFKRENNYGSRAGDWKEYMDWERVPVELEKLCENTMQLLKSEGKVLFGINKFHYEFVNEIHPFGDGNGRLVRLIHNLLLMKNEFPPLIIEGEEKSTYLNAIIKQEKDPSGLAFDSFLTRKVIKMMEKRMGIKSRK